MSTLLLDLICTTIGALPKDLTNLIVSYVGVAGTTGVLVGKYEFLAQHDH